MPNRTTPSQVTFRAPFVLAEIDGPLPPGTYDIETEEEVVEGNGRTVYIRKATTIRLKEARWTRTVTINPAGLEAALLADASQAG